jgi:acyl-lipid omega-6 desaturase (Delta-12 desaturase)
MTYHSVQDQLRDFRWQEIVAHYASPDLTRSLWQLANTLGGFLLMWYIMYLSLQIHYVLTLLLAIPTAGFGVRAFIILHDCGHGSFTKSQKINDVIGSVCGVLTFTAYLRWRHEHAIHHATAGDLDRRGTGDVPTLTIREYLDAPWWKKAIYRIVRHPALLFPILMPLAFIFLERVYFGKGGRREKLSVISTDLALLAIVLIAAQTIGIQAYLSVQIPILFVSSAVGGWLFYVQHQFEDTYWQRHPEWEYLRASLEGSSYYKLPKVLQWFTGNIGFHHIHHLSPKIPNYFLEKCFKENPIFQHVPTLTIWASFKTASLALWDEELQTLVSWRALKRVQGAH